MASREKAPWTLRERDVDSGYDERQDYADYQ